MDDMGLLADSFFLFLGTLDLYCISMYSINLNERISFSFVQFFLDANVKLNYKGAHESSTNLFGVVVSFEMAFVWSVMLIKLHLVMRFM